MINTTYIGLVTLVCARELGEDAKGSPDLLRLKSGEIHAVTVSHKMNLPPSSKTELYSNIKM